MLTTRERLAQKIEKLGLNTTEKECEEIIVKLKDECKGEEINAPLKNLKTTFPEVIIDAYIEAVKQRCDDPTKLPEKIVEKLVVHMMANQAKLDALDRSNQTLLQRAIKNLPIQLDLRQLNAIEWLLDRFSERGDEYFKKLVPLAAQRRQYQLVFLLIETYGYDVNETDSNGCSALYYATQQGNAGDAQKLRQLGGAMHASDTTLDVYQRLNRVHKKYVTQDGLGDHLSKFVEVCKEVHNSETFYRLAGHLNMNDSKWDEVRVHMSQFKDVPAQHHIYDNFQEYFRNWTAAQARVVSGNDADEEEVEQVQKQVASWRLGGRIAVLSEKKEDAVDPSMKNKIDTQYRTRIRMACLKKTDKQIVELNKIVEEMTLDELQALQKISLGEWREKFVQNVLPAFLETRIAEKMKDRPAP